ncbi:MAG TPA: cation:proton antiporter [Prolixibacteraceae bacterium]|nr:cation:proton antiporter [Prolixibacteraceae bacterium]
MEFSVLKDIVIIFALSSFVNYLFTRIKVPTIIGYLLTGVLVGPKLMGIIKAPHEIELMAEIGVVLLLFMIGMEFSLNHLFRIRRRVFLGGFLQLLLTTLLTTLFAHAYNLEWKASLFIGFLTALSSTAVVLKILQDRSELTSNYGRTVLGILIFQDVILVPLMLFTPFLAGGEVDYGGQLLMLALKSVIIIGFLYVGNRWLMPRLLHKIAITRNQELFMMIVLLICLSVALMTYQMGMPLAFGAFLAGLMISESEYSHDAFGNLVTFRDTFTSFFFVSIGMMLDLSFIAENFTFILFTVTIVVLLKMIVGGLTAFLLGHTFRGTVLVGVAISQVGEFSFILAKLGKDYAILDQFYYQTFLAVAVITMSVSPFMIRLGTRISNQLLRLPIPKVMIDGLFPLKQIEIPVLRNHLVLIGKDSRALNLSKMARYYNLPYVSIIFDPEIARQRQEKGEIVVYGDAFNIPILQKAYVNNAHIVVISIGKLDVLKVIIDKVRQLNKHAAIVVRTRHIEDIEALYNIGATQVIPEEFETAIDLFERVMGNFLLPRKEIDDAIDQIRSHHYGIFLEENSTTRYNISKDIPDVEIIPIEVMKDAPILGKSLVESQLRQLYGITLVALKRDHHIIDHPKPSLVFCEGDVAYILGKTEKISMAAGLFSK